SSASTDTCPSTQTTHPHPPQTTHPLHLKLRILIHLEPHILVHPVNSNARVISARGIPRGAHWSAARDPKSNVCPLRATCPTARPILYRWTLTRCARPDSIGLHGGESNLERA